VVVTLDPHWTQAGWVLLDLPALGLPEGASFEVEDLLTAARYRWQGRRNFVSLDPVVLPAHVFQLRSKEVVL
jgi:starch synthase (maltosyl-transferring)